VALRPLSVTDTRIFLEEPSAATRTRSVVENKADEVNGA
jgi:hypothetical protein